MRRSNLQMLPLSYLFLSVILCVLSAQHGVTNSQLTCDHCPTRPLCLGYTLADTTCGGNLTVNGFNVTINDSDSQVQQIRISLNGSVFELSENVSYDVRVIREVCEGAELFSLQHLLVENSTSCNSTINRMNEIVINCDGENFNPGAEMGLFVTDCSGNCTDSIYIIEYTNCSCGMEERNWMQEASTMWDECSEVDIGGVHPQQGKECLRQRCIKFLDEACSCCSINCESNPYYSVHASAVCPTHLKANCTFSGSLCGTSCSLDCNGRHEQFCEGVCKNPFQSISSSLNMSEVKEYCVGQINQNCSDLILSDINCTVTPMKCARICQKDKVIGFFAEGCLIEVLQFCETFIDDLLLLTEDDYQMYIGTVRTFVRQMLPSTVVDKLQSLFNAPTAKDLLTIPNHAEMLLDVYDSLFDDELNSSLASSHETVSTVLHQLNTLAKLIGEDFLEGRRTAPFTVMEDNLIFSVRVPNRTEEVNNTHIFTIEGDGSLNNFTAHVKISTDLLCQEKVKRCSSAVTFIVANNMADYLHSALINQGDRFARNYKTGSELLSVQVVGVQNLSKLLSESKMKIIFPLQRHFNRVRCISTSNQSQYTWSGNGVFTGRLNSQTIRCSSNHTGSFAVLLTNDPYIVHEIAPPDGVITIISHVSSMVSIVSLLATIICLIIFRKILNKGPLLYVHLNLAIALMFGLLFLIVAVDNIHFKGLRDIVPLCMIVAVVTHYFLLAAFFWMLCEGIMLYILLVRVFGNAVQRWYLFLFPGWGLPFLIVLISAAVLQENYIAPRSFLFENCWLNPGFTKAAYWTFTGPMIIVILINSVILVLVLINIVRGRKRGGAEAGVKNRTLVVTAIKGTVVLFPLLGITWGIGVFGAVYNQYPIFAWIFVFLNNFQGLFIFVIHVLRNGAVWRKLKQICCSVVSRRSEVTVSSGLSNNRVSMTPSGDSTTKLITPNSSSALDSVSSNQKEHNSSLTVEVEVGSEVCVNSAISEEINNVHP